MFGESSLRTMACVSCARTQGLVDNFVVFVSVVAVVIAVAQHDVNISYGCAFIVFVAVVLVATM